MPMKMNEGCTLKTGQIKKNPELALGMSQKDVSKYKKVASAYGNVAPVIVAAPEKGVHLILAGNARLEACVQAGMGEIPAVVARTSGAAEGMKLSLMLSSIHEEGGAISEGALISRLIEEHKVTPRELVNLLGKSKAWVSKRMSLAQNLTASVKGMVSDGTLCPRSAEEVAKLPEEEQAEFASNIVNSGLNKNEISQLVKWYKNASSDAARREAIKYPLNALSKIGVRISRKPRASKGLNSPGRQLAGSANYAAQMLLKAVNMAENADEGMLRAAGGQLARLRDVAAETDMALNRLLPPEIIAPKRPPLRASKPILPDVSPGKQKTAGPAVAGGGFNGG